MKGIENSHRFIAICSCFVRTLNTKCSSGLLCLQKKNTAVLKKVHGQEARLIEVWNTWNKFSTKNKPGFFSLKKKLAGEKIRQYGRSPQNNKQDGQTG